MRGDSGLEDDWPMGAHQGRGGWPGSKMVRKGVASVGRKDGRSKKLNWDTHMLGAHLFLHCTF